jgi:hypothetical protein
LDVVLDDRFVGRVVHTIGLAVEPYSARDKNPGALLNAVFVVWEGQIWWACQDSNLGPRDYEVGKLIARNLLNLDGRN